MSDRIGYLHNVGRKLTLMTGVAVAALTVSGCDLARNQLKQDRAANMEMQDFRDGLAPRIPEDTEDLASDDDSDIPSLEPYVAPPSDNLKPMPLVSISVNQTVPLRDALFELAEQANYDIELDPRISGSIIFTARERPFDVVIRRISEIAGLRYKFEDDTLRVELDTPYYETYKIDYLSYIRNNSSTISNDVSVVTGGGADTGSRFEATSESQADFWGELEANLTQILGVGPTSGNLKSKATPQITAAPQSTPAVQPVAATDANGATTVQVQAPQATLEVNSLPTEPEETTTGTAPGQGGGNGPSFAVNKQAGIISIFATERQHKQIKQYLETLRRSVTAQVLIEAKILEVGLSDEYAAGVSWGDLAGELTGGLIIDDGGVGARPSLNPAQLNPLTTFELAYNKNNVQAVVDALSRFGTVRALASPRLTVLNNQSAVLNVATNEVYFELSIDVTTSDNTTQAQIDSDIRNVPEGVLINVQPSIDLDNQTVSMAVRPTVTRITRTVEDPSVQFAAAANNIDGVSSNIPVVNVQEMDSVVSLHSGQAMLMGGLMQDRTDGTTNGIPVLSEVPLVGALFRNQVDQVQKTELVVFLKATILDGSQKSIHQTDKDLYNTFSGDRRPERM